MDSVFAPLSTKSTSSQAITNAACRSRTMRRLTLLCLFALSPLLFAQKANTPPPTKPLLVSVDITKLPVGATHLDLWLLCGQSNMKGRGFMPEEPKNDARIVMMHLKDDAKTFQGHDNAAIGLMSCAFAGSPPHQALAERRVALKASV